MTESGRPSDRENTKEFATDSVRGTTASTAIEAPGGPIPVERMTPQRTALHESSHAVLATLCGIEITEVTMEPPQCVTQSPIWAVEGSEAWGLPLAATDPEVAGQMAVSLVTVVAQRLWGADPGNYDDARHARAMAARIDDSEYTDKLLTVLEEVVVELKPVIEAVAAELCETKTLTGARVREIIDKRGGRN